jgi:hypothetical protein
MGKKHQGFFSDINIIKKISDKWLMKLINRFPNYFDQYHVTTNNTLITEKLQDALFNKKNMEVPEELQEMLYTLSEMSTESRHDELIKIFSCSSPCTPQELALRCRLERPDLFNDAYNRSYIQQKRSFKYFRGNKIDPAFTYQTVENTVKRIGADHGNWCKQNNRLEHVKCTSYEKSKNVFYIIVSYGAPLRREGQIKSSGETKKILYHPEKNDLIIYNNTHGVLQIHSENSTKELCQQYTQLLGNIWFNNPKYFHSSEKPFTLKPLESYRDQDYDWRQSDNIISIALCTVKIKWPSNLETRQTNGDYFPELLKRNQETSLTITSATFKVQFINSKQPRTVRIEPDKAVYVRNEDSILIEDWMRTHGFWNGN